MEDAIYNILLKLSNNINTDKGNENNDKDDSDNKKENSQGNNACLLQVKIVN